MWNKRPNSIERVTKFFFIAMCHNTLQNYYLLNFSMMQHHKYSLTEIENMIPWEKEIYVQLLNDHIQEENERMRREQG